MSSFESVVRIIPPTQSFGAISHAAIARCWPRRTGSTQHEAGHHERQHIVTGFGKIMQLTMLRNRSSSTARATSSVAWPASSPSSSSTARRSWSSAARLSTSPASFSARSVRTSPSAYLPRSRSRTPRREAQLRRTRQHDALETKTE